MNNILVSNCIVFVILPKALTFLFYFFFMFFSSLPFDIILIIIYFLQPKSSNKTIKTKLNFLGKLNNIPSLILLGSICKSWRFVSFKHDFWYDFYWVNLLPKTLKIRNLNNFFGLISNEKHRLNAIKHIHIENPVFVDFDMIFTILNKINPNNVKSVNLVWIHFSSDKIIKLISNFKNLQILKLKGVYDGKLINGLNNSQLKRLNSANLTKLEYLQIDRIFINKRFWS